MTFKERFLRGDCNMDAINDWVAFWHDGIADGQGLQEFLGFTDEEYATWLSKGPEGLAKAIRKDAQAQFKAVYLTWPELADQLQSLVQQILGMACEVSAMRLNFYYWEMRIDFVAHIDEALSAEICERLELQGVKSDRFVNHSSVYENQILQLLEKLTGYEVLSSHADDNGVWIICKEYWTSSQGYAEHLISDCEKRLRIEIRSKHYRLVNPDTACHQLFGFKEALKVLGILPEGKCAVRPDHFADMAPHQSTVQNRRVQANVDKPSPEAIQKALQCLSNNGIAADEAEAVLQALGHILFDTEIM